MADQLSKQDADGSRRNFIKNTSAVVAGGAIFGAQAGIARSANVNGSSEIKIAVIGCGGRGTGAAYQALATEGPVTLWAMADAFEDNLQSSLRTLERQVSRPGRDADWLKDSKIDVPTSRQFVGFDAYKHAIDSGADLVILATPPGFRPLHFEAAVNADKHIFTEKPVASDATGIRRFLAANEKAKEKNLMVAVGLQRRHEPRYIETIEKLQDGAIGDINLTRVYWNGNRPWTRPRKSGQNEMQYQMRNWYYFTWLGGDHIVEQHIHNLDVSNWLKDGHPVEANGMGGHEIRTNPDHGEIFDHHFVEFTYPDGSKMFSQCRHIGGCWNEVTEYAHGSKGTSHIGGGKITGGDGEWETSAQGVNGHHQEHHDLFAALRRGDIYNEGEYGAHSTMTAILGRMATYSGKVLTWEEAINHGRELTPGIDGYSFDSKPPVMPKDGSYEAPTPGKTEVLA